MTVLQSNGSVGVIAFPIRPQRRPELINAGFHVVQGWKEVVSLGGTHAIIATDTLRHVEDIQAALEAGCNVLVEKPMAIDAASAYRSLQTAQSAGRKMWVGYCLRFQEALNVFREQLGHIGKVHSVRIECQSYLPDWRPERSYRDSYSARPEEGGVLRDLVHEIDYATWLFGWPSTVQSRVGATRQLGIDSEDTADLLWDTENGIVVSIRLDYLSRPARRQMRACGEHGTLEWDGSGGSVKLELAGKSLQSYLSSQTRNDMYLAQDLAFLEADCAQFDPRLATAEEGVRTLAICDAARRASQSRREETIHYS